MRVAHHDFLIEIGTEELPPKALLTLQNAFVAGLEAGLGKASLRHGEIEGFATPRRLAARVSRLAAAQPEQHQKRRGPPVRAAFDAAGAPTRAALAFADSCGTTVEALQKLDEGKGSFLFFVGSRPGEPAARLLPGIVQSALDQLPIPRRMHWGDGTALFVRPVHWVVMLFGREIVPATLLETAADRMTRGHRFHAPGRIRIASPGAYERTLRERGYVVAGFAGRRERIRADVMAAAAGLNGRALIGDALLDEVTALVEWPVVLSGGFEPRFLSLPREVLISTLQDHQRYFPVEDAHRQLLPAFITVSNIESRDPSQVRAGNERVVRPRLADAAFFFEQDRRQPLAARMAGLDAVTYQAQLGSLGDKTRRVAVLAAALAADTGGSPVQAQRAAHLSKCDLLSAMVGEFPELQGIMGAYYAQADGESPEVASAIREHYLPRVAGDALPGTPAGIAVALADKLDSLAAIFSIGGRPTGTKDPFGLRRAALGVQRILIEKALDVDLMSYIGRALAAVRADIDRVRIGVNKESATADLSITVSPRAHSEKPTQGQEAGAWDIYDFLMERLRSYYLERAGSATPPGTAAVTAEMFDAVLAARPASPVDFDARLKALSTFLGLPESASLTAANKRIANILRRGGDEAAREVDVSRLREAAEVRLYDSMRGLRDSVAAATHRREYTAALGQLAQLRPAVDAFFDQVMVMDEDPLLRANRLGLLAQLQGLFAGVADLSRLPG
ncbi:MAG: glycine--tRNA ligase subunit beta [Steroidobacteraceae bacterium]